FAPLRSVPAKLVLLAVALLRLTPAMRAPEQSASLSCEFERSAPEILGLAGACAWPGAAMLEVRIVGPVLVSALINVPPRRSAPRRLQPCIRVPRRKAPRRSARRQVAPVRSA